MKTNNTPNVSDLARWIDLQLSTIIEGVSAGYTLGNYNSVWIDKGATVFNVSLANGETVEIDSDNYNTAEEIATAIISTLNNTPTTMNANEKYNYLEAVTADVLDYINENNITVTTENRDEIEQQLNDDLWAVDSVTGNASGSYTFSTWQAEKNICHNLDLLAEACEEFGSDAAKLLNGGAEACDVTIRCYLLGQAIAAALDEVETEEEEEEPEEDTEA